MLNRAKYSTLIEDWTHDQIIQNMLYMDKECAICWALWMMGLKKADNYHKALSSEVMSPNIQSKMEALTPQMATKHFHHEM